MAVQSYIAQDAAFRTLVMQDMQNFVEQNADTFHYTWENTKTVKVSQKGNEQIFTSGIQAPLLASAGGVVEYPQGVTIERDRFKAQPVEQTVSYEIDVATYRDYKAGSESVWANLRDDMQMTAAEWFKYQDQWLAGDGSGTVGVIQNSGARVSTSTLVYLFTTPGGVHAKGFGVDNIKKNVPYDIYNGATLVDGNFTFSSVDRVNNSAVPTAALSGAPTEGWTIHPAGSKGLFPRGFDYGVRGSKTFWQGANASGKPELNSMTKDGSGQLISNIDFQDLLISNALRRGDGVNAKFTLLISPSLHGSYLQQGWGAIGFSNGGNSGTMDMSFSNAKYEGSTFKLCRNLDPDRFYSNPAKNMTKLVQFTPDWYTEAGQIFSRAYGVNGRGQSRMFAQFGGAYQWFYENSQNEIVGKNYDVSGVRTKATYFS